MLLEELSPEVCTVLWEWVRAGLGLQLCAPRPNDDTQRTIGYDCGSQIWCSSCGWPAGPELRGEARIACAYCQSPRVQGQKSALNHCAGKRSHLERNFYFKIKNKNKN